ncbi:MAG: hypothetical protein KDI30_07695 [Pseudomonadales bacterium]|nr:hypothetical protein [Pseudomonadales bacterium]
MTDIHIDDFYKDVAKILLQLYIFFPKPATLYVEDISGPDQPDEFGLHSDRHQAAFSTIIWLGKTGFLHYEDTIRQEAVDQAVLTKTGFTLLSDRSRINPDEDDVVKNYPPSVVEEISTNINLIRKALKSKSSIEIRHCIQHIINQSRFH